MIERLEAILSKYNQLEKALEDPEIYNDINKMKKYSQEKTAIEEVVFEYKKYKKVLEDINTAKAMMKEADLEDFAKDELNSLVLKKEEIENKFPILLLSKDPNDDKNVIMEIRGAAGGDEANIFAGDLFKMYSKYIEKQGWSIEILNQEDGESGGFSQIEFMIKGKNVYSKLKYESGAHRVQRVPETESQGRVHTSTATVLVMPEAEEVDIKIDPKDLKIDVYRSSGCGGQGVNTTDSAVRITHIPTGIVVTCQNERSQIKNKEKALTILKTRIYDKYLQEQEEKNEEKRKNKIGTGDRSEKIRTYNYPQNRLTDHRINYTVMHLDKIMDGDLEELIEALVNEDKKRRIEEEN